MEWTVKKNVADIVLTMYYVIMSVGSVREVVKTVILEHIVVIVRHVYINFTIHSFTSLIGINNY